ncbi:hypothetical protein Acr_00g0013350 [Actinidia rufa]|uniref:Uncharacterized protein n=1 Tax=Actinidia rufa TaxID=165716 RepID=A0A7J0DBQ6_9ERIC|nr:hypothetical protein Acr_00g0013350 [Actinidia rufa]
MVRMSSVDASPRCLATSSWSTSSWGLRGIELLSDFHYPPIHRGMTGREPAKPYIYSDRNEWTTRMSSHHKYGNDTEQTSGQEAGKEKALRKAVVLDWAFDPSKLITPPGTRIRLRFENRDNPSSVCMISSTMPSKDSQEARPVFDSGDRPSSVNIIPWIKKGLILPAEDRIFPSLHTIGMKKFPVIAYELNGTPIYQGRSETGHIWWDPCNCDDCYWDRFEPEDEYEPKGKRKSKKGKKTTQQLLHERKKPVPSASTATVDPMPPFNPEVYPPVPDSQPGTMMSLLLEVTANALANSVPPPTPLEELPAMELPLPELPPIEFKPGPEESNYEQMFYQMELRDRTEKYVVNQEIEDWVRGVDPSWADKLLYGNFDQEYHGMTAAEYVEQHRDENGRFDPSQLITAPSAK